MGITMHEVDRLRSMNVLKPQANVLDIGSSNLYSATEEALRRFMASFGPGPAKDDIDGFIRRFAAGSEYGPDGGKNESFLGELLERVGLRYLSFDIADG